MYTLHRLVERSPKISEGLGGDKTTTQSPLTRKLVFITPMLYPSNLHPSLDNCE